MTVIASNFYKTFSSEIFEKSQCMQHEQNFANFFSSILSMLGYVTYDSTRRIWQRDSKQVIVCFVDDFETSNYNFFKEQSKQMYNKITVITDNHVIDLPQHQVIQLPDSYFGIYAYTPQIQHFIPTRRFNFSINRIDTQRELILLELINQNGNITNLLNTDWINFNCYYESELTKSLNNISNNYQKKFLECWDNISDAHGLIYSKYIDKLLIELPISNYKVSFDQAHTLSYINLIVETYAGDTTITLSEKTFRALVTPAPWTLYAAQYSVQYLISLGFDVLNDIIDHNYNNVSQNNSANGIEKIKLYIDASLKLYVNLKRLDQNYLQTRCQAAAKHNQQLLFQMRENWPQDLANWLPRVIAQLE